MADGEHEELLTRMVDDLVATGCITSPSVEAAFRAVPRHLFLPDAPLSTVYRHDAALPVHVGQDGEVMSTSSAPSIMACMVEQLSVEPGQAVLEIGVGENFDLLVTESSYRTSQPQ
jgi:protein-L-isoaspartate(D-aspartate) O-methyltransferase